MTTREQELSLDALASLVPVLQNLVLLRESILTALDLMPEESPLTDSLDAFDCMLDLVLPALNPIRSYCQDRYATLTTTDD